MSLGTIHILLLDSRANMVLLKGASPAEQVFEACRRNNTELLQEIITKIHTSSDKKSAHAKVAQFLNSVTDALGNHCLHLAASSGSCMWFILR